MGFVAGVMRLFGVVDEDPQDNMLEYPVAAQSQAPVPSGGRMQAYEARHQQPAQAEQPRVINMPQPEKQTVFIVRPAFDDSGRPAFSMKTYACYLLTRQALVLDVNELAATDLEEATRVVDYLSGVVEAVEGSVWEVAKNIFIFAPNNVGLAGDPLKPLEVY
ncbi:cell division protein SepF [bacterium]|nr:cell division protein SepF [bacterium]